MHNIDRNPSCPSTAVTSSPTSVGHGDGAAETVLEKEEVGVVEGLTPTLRLDVGLAEVLGVRDAVGVDDGMAPGARVGVAVKDVVADRDSVEDVDAVPPSVIDAVEDADRLPE